MKLPVVFVYEILISDLKLFIVLAKKKICFSYIHVHIIVRNKTSYIIIINI